MEPPTIDDLWSGFDSVALAFGATRAERAEIKMAFYSGAGAVLATLKSIAEDPAQVVDGKAMVDGWWDECDRFLTNPATIPDPVSPRAH